MNALDVLSLGPEVWSWVASAVAGCFIGMEAAHLVAEHQKRRRLPRTPPCERCGDRQSTHMIPTVLAPVSMDVVKAGNRPIHVGNMLLCWTCALEVPHLMEEHDLVFTIAPPVAMGEPQEERSRPRPS